MKLPLPARLFLRATLPDSVRHEIVADLEEGFARHRRAGAASSYLWLLGQLVRLRPWALRRALRRSSAEPARVSSPHERVANAAIAGWSSDLRQARRGLFARASFSVAVIVTVAMAIGATTSVFSVVNGVLLRPLDFDEPDRLVLAWQTRPEWEDNPNAQLRQFARHFPLSIPTFFDWQSAQTGFESMGIYGGAQWVWQTSERAELVNGMLVSAGLFRALGVAPEVGRYLTDEDDAFGAQPVVVLSHGMWTTRVGADPDVVGRTLSLDGQPHVVVGVMPAGFDVPGQSAEMWGSIATDDDWGERGNQSYTVLGRLSEGATLESAERDLFAIQEGLSERYPADQVDMRATVTGVLEYTVGDVRTTLLFLLIAVGLVLAIACVNIANMLSVNGLARGRELAIKAAVGASRPQLVRALLTESAVLAGLGGLLGVIGAWVALPVMVEALPATVPRTDDISMDGRVLAFGSAVTALTALVVGALPALQVVGSSPRAVLSASSRALAGGTTGHRIRNGLVVTEVALAFVLLVGAGLLATSFTKLWNVDRGFESEGLLVLFAPPNRVDFPDPDDRALFHEQLGERLRAIPGVRTARTNQVPLAGSSSSTTFYLDEDDGSQSEVSLMISVVDPDYFEVAGVRLAQGRRFDGSELPDAQLVGVANEALVALLWPGGSGIGEELRDEEDGPATTIIGVTRDVRHNSLTRAAEPKLYVPVAQSRREADQWVLRVEGSPGAVADLARQAVAAVSSTTPVQGVDVLEERIARRVAVPRFRTLFVVGLAAIATLLALLGVYGVMSFTVSQQRREVAVRMAIGAHPRAVIWSTVRGGLALAGGGVVLGLSITWLAARTTALDDFLFEVEAVNPLAWALVALVVALVGVAASWIPAARAAGVDPVTVLGSD